jgi:hypothetical protein
MRNRSFSDEAEACRRQAAQFVGRPEGPFLLRVAQSFEELEAVRRRPAERTADPATSVFYIAVIFLMLFASYYFIA